MSQDVPDYQVGYGRPPRHTRFRKGRSGNPNGRPKGVQSFARLANQVFNEKIAIKENGERRIITKLQAALKQLANKAASGDAAAIRDMLRLQAALTELELPGNRVARTKNPSQRPQRKPTRARSRWRSSLFCVPPGKSSWAWLPVRSPPNAPASFFKSLPYWMKPDYAVCRHHVGTERKSGSDAGTPRVDIMGRGRRSYLLRCFLESAQPGATGAEPGITASRGIRTRVGTACLQRRG
jgi:hypothetical protein